MLCIFFATLLVDDDAGWTLAGWTLMATLFLFLRGGNAVAKVTAIRVTRTSAVCKLNIKFQIKHTPKLIFYEKSSAILTYSEFGHVGLFVAKELS